MHDNLSAFKNGHAEQQARSDFWTPLEVQALKTALALRQESIGGQRQGRWFLANFLATCCDVTAMFLGDFGNFALTGKGQGGECPWCTPEIASGTEYEMLIDQLIQSYRILVLKVVLDWLSSTLYRYQLPLVIETLCDADRLFYSVWL